MKNGLLTKLFVMLGFVSPSFLVFAYQEDSAINSSKDDAFYFVLTQKGFDVIAREIKKNVVNDLDHKRIPDIDVDLSVVPNVRTYGMNLDAKFDQLTVKPAADKLELSVTLNSFTLRVPYFYMYYQLWGRELGSACKDLEIKLGTKTPIKATGITIPSVENRYVKLNPEGISLDIGEDNVEVVGPAKCDSISFFDKVQKHLIAYILRRYVGNIKDQIGERFLQFVPKIEESINKLLARELVVKPHFVAPIINQDWLIMAKPSYLKSSEGRLEVRYFVDLKAIESTEENLLPANQLFLKEDTFFQNSVIGEVGFDPEFITIALKDLFPNGTDRLELSEYAVPGVRDFMDAKALAHIFPELNTFTPDEEFLRLSARLKSIPEFKINREKNIVQMYFPSVDLMSYVMKDGEWIPFVEWDVQISADLSISTENGLIKFTLLEQPRVSAVTRWYPDYKASDTKIDQEKSEQLMRNVIKTIYRGKSVFTIKFPIFSFGGNRVTTTQSKIEGSFVKFLVNLLEGNEKGLRLSQQE